ncbi:hypothetical protein DPMN_008919 [Dreissena polymorpha]|uniref:Uncharacterized protein n=1 Tax=Dreissena polymorpha TaxID=45954 RepID=A0A9D4MZ19_DREPO|nr:hypothetical protein DPMN_008919 [Dreissena polymorpha]
MAEFALKDSSHIREMNETPVEKTRRISGRWVRRKTCRKDSSNIREMNERSVAKTRPISERWVRRKTCRKDSSYIREMGQTKDLSQTQFSVSRHHAKE